MSWSKVGTVAKAVGAGAAAGIGSLLLVVTGNETLSDVTQAEWLLVAFNVLGTYGITWAIPNRELP